MMWRRDFTICSRDVMVCPAKGKLFSRWKSCTVSSKLAKAVGYGSEPVLDSPHGGIGYFSHYHATYKNNKKNRRGHIFFL